MKAKLLILLSFLAAALGVLYFNFTRNAATSESAPPKASESQPSALPAPSSSTKPVDITFVFSTEKKDWIDAALGEFATAHKEIKVSAVGKGSLEASDQILDGSLKPALWSPADSLVLNLFATDYQTKFGKSALPSGSEEAPQPLLLSPLVFVAWEDRAQVLLAAGKGEMTWKALHSAVSSNKGWVAVKGKPEWGFVKLGHTDPSRSNSGLQALFLMSLEFYGKTSLKVEDLLRPDYQKFVRELESGVSRFEASTGTFMVDMVRFGPSKYDVAVVYESSAISQIANAQGRWGNLQVFYPKPTLWSDHPIALLSTDWVTPEQRRAAKLLMDFLLSRPQQERALTFGFRPADLAIPIKTTDPSNPFVRLASYGLHADVPPVAETPDGAVVKNLLMMWSRVVPRR